MDEPQHTQVPAYDAEDEYRPEPPQQPALPAWMDGSLRIGIHTSIAGDLVNALETAANLGCNALQIFSASPRMWSRAPGRMRISEADAQRFRARREALGLGPLVIHDNYLINLASPEPFLRTRSMQAFHDELVRAEALGADFLIAHPGSPRDSGRAAGIAAIADGLHQAVRGIRFGGLRILLENTAGQGSSIGGRFEDLQEIMDACRDLPIGVCVDTAHLFEAGHDIRTEAGWNATLERIDRTVGLERVFVVHVNDSKTPLGSHADRHQHIGKGKIGAAAFRRILNHRLLAGRAFILETPIDKPGDDRRNVAMVWRLAGQKPLRAASSRDGFRVRRRKARPRKRARAKGRIVARKGTRKGKV